VFVDLLGEEKGDRLVSLGMALPTSDQRKDFFRASLEEVRQRLEGRARTDALLAKGKYRHNPVPVQQFLEDPFYLGLEGQIYDAVMQETININSGKYVEIVLTGAIGTAKTTIALWSTAYQLYLISCLRNPQQTFGLDRASEILFIFQSINADLARKLDYGRFRELLEKSPYFAKYFPYRKDLESEMQFPHRVIARPVAGMETAAIGQNVIGGIIDELNYMAVIENSKSSVDGGTYDQAVALYNSIARRRKSRFMQQGSMPGLLCLVSSKRYPGQFTDIKEQEATKDPTIYVYDKRVWEIKPSAFGGEWFHVFIGTPTRKPRILEPDEPIAAEDRHLVMEIPEEYRGEFETDMMNALREIAGVSTIARHPFIMNPDAVAAMMTDKPSVFGDRWTDYEANKLMVRPKVVRNKTMPRFAHLDLSITGDNTGLVVGHVDGFVEVSRGATSELLPHIVIDGALQIRPPRGGEILFHKIRDTLYKLRDVGLPIKWVTFDSFQSVDSIQVLRQHGFLTGMQSLDKTMTPYQFLKSALYDGRIECPHHPELQKELASLEFIADKNRVDHPPNGSKDVADALAGVVYGLTVRREVWVRHGVSPVKSSPSVLEALSQQPADVESKAA
jgi:hypothetical protein